MTYELAKELKDAGFERKHDPKGTQSIENIMDADLSELIEACGENLNILARLKPEQIAIAGFPWWAADDPVRRFDEPHKGAGGATPEEAVARLWLVLNKK